MTRTLSHAYALPMHRTSSTDEPAPAMSPAPVPRRLRAAFWWTASAIGILWYVLLVVLPATEIAADELPRIRQAVSLEYIARGLVLVVLTAVLVSWCLRRLIAWSVSWSRATGVGILFIVSGCVICVLMLSTCRALGLFHGNERSLWETMTYIVPGRVCAALVISGMHSLVLIPCATLSVGLLRKTL